MASPLLGSQLGFQSDGRHLAGPSLSASSILAFWHLASLDAPTVAVVWALAIAASVHVHLEPWIITLLATGTWTVYVLDRLLDARRAIRSLALGVLRDRHHFHWRHRRVLLPLASCTAAASVTLIFRLMPATTREHNSVIAIAALAYFSGVHASAQFPRWLRSLFSKEMLVGSLFAIGCAAPTFTRLHTSGAALAAVLGLAFLALLAWLNCAAISAWESRDAGSAVHTVAAVLALAGLLLAASLPRSLAPTAALLGCGALSALSISALHLVRKHSSPLVLRALADLVLLTPAVLLIPGVLPR